MARSSLLYIVFFSLVLTQTSSAQIAVLDSTWLKAETPYFTLLSQLPAGDTQQIAYDFATWRQLAGYFLPQTAAQTTPPVPLHIYIFNSPAELAQFNWGDQPAGFHPSPRGNFLVALGDPESLKLARHQYSHFLINNFLPSTIPRWYEEGLADYMGRLHFTDNVASVTQFDENKYNVGSRTSTAMPLAELLYDEDSLASPLLVQLANEKSALLFHFLLHAGEHPDFIDYREQLNAYLQLLHEGRTARYAFDRGFSVSVSRLDREYERYLPMEKPQPIFAGSKIAITNQSIELAAVAGPSLALTLAELALHAGQFATAEQLFAYVVANDNSIGRAHSGLADAFRMQEIAVELPLRYQRAIDLEPDNPSLQLDYGQYIEAELLRCDVDFTDEQRSVMTSAMLAYFERALALAPDDAEANLSVAQVYLFPEQDWRAGLSFQQRGLALLPADTFVAEQAVNYAIAAENFDEAQALIDKLARPIHLWGEPYWITQLSNKLNAKRRGREYDACSAQ